MRATNRAARFVADRYWSVRVVVARIRRSLRVNVPILARRVAPIAIAIVGLVLAMDGQWTTARTAAAQPLSADLPKRPASANTNATSASDTSIAPVGKKKLSGGKLNLNTATSEQLMQLPTVGPSKAERMITWRKKNGGFKRIADIRRVKGFGYKTFKRLEPYLDVAGPTTLTTH